ncbi:hypothetical protein [Sulfurivirga caldicuralii]|nr:hypothetical protein [Sulfurivirga caldicuralii]
MHSPDNVVGMPGAALALVQGVSGVAGAAPLLLDSTTVRFPTDVSSSFSS